MPRRKNRKGLSSKCKAKVSIRFRSIAPQSRSHFSDPIVLLFFYFSCSEKSSGWIAESASQVPEPAESFAGDTRLPRCRHDLSLRCQAAQGILRCQYLKFKCQDKTDVGVDGFCTNRPSMKCTAEKITVLRHARHRPFSTISHCIAKWNRSRTP